MSKRDGKKQMSVTHGGVSVAKLERGGEKWKKNKPPYLRGRSVGTRRGNTKKTAYVALRCSSSGRKKRKAADLFEGDANAGHGALKNECSVSLTSLRREMGRRKDAAPWTVEKRRRGAFSGSHTSCFSCV